MTNDHSARCAQTRRNRITLGALAQITCPTTGKRQFRTEQLAQAELDKVQKLRAHQPRNGHCENKYYRCASCWEFHLSSRSR